MNNISNYITAIGGILKSISGIVIFGFLVYSLYFTGDYTLTVFWGIVAFFLLSFFVGFTSMIPLGTTFSPILFEWWWHDIPFWDFTMAAWIATAISMIANVILIVGILLNRD